jgi:hypothetical protein
MDSVESPFRKGDQPDSIRHDGELLREYTPRLTL